MNGTSFLRRSASILLTSSLVFVAACGVGFNGLFEGDAAVDGAVPLDAATDSNSSDRAPDTRMDVAADGGVGDSGTDRSSTDGSPDDQGGVDATMDPDAISGGD